MVARRLRPELVALCVVLGCNPILGIEPAELDPMTATGASGGAGNGDGGSMGQGGVPPCAGSAEACEACLQTRCAAEYKGCVASNDCRLKLHLYRLCLDLDAGMACSAERAADCATQVAGPFEALNLNACAFVLQNGCKNECHGAPLGDPCVPFCACMPRACPGAITGSCQAYCAALNADQQRCQLHHCEWALADPAQHCPHAIGINCYEGT